jgi:hypothetical protein
MRLQGMLNYAAAKSTLPKEASGQDDLNELLLTLRTEGCLPKGSRKAVSVVGVEESIPRSDLAALGSIS